jgi:hypothetical protein
MARAGAARGNTDLIVPARPNKKSEYPDVPMEEYIARKGPQGLPFDPWLRVHTRLGGQS